MPGPMQAPHPRDLIEVPVDLEVGDEPWVNTATARASCGDVVALTWDVVAASVFIRWTAAGRIVLELTRESVDRLSIQVRAGEVIFDVLMETEGATGQLFLRVGDTVTATDSILRR
jgi:hypothetical protein